MNDQIKFKANFFEERTLAKGINSIIRKIQRFGIGDQRQMDRHETNDYVQSVSRFSCDRLVDEIREKDRPTK